MKRDVARFLVLILDLVLPLALSAQGTAGFEILRLQTYARGSAMGGSLVADAGHIESIFYNPAGLKEINQRMVVAGYMNYLLDIHSGFLAYTEPRGPYGIWGLNVLYTNYGDFDERDKNGADLGTFTASDVVLGLTWANTIHEKVNVGGSAKFAYSDISGYIGSALAFDLGAQYNYLPGQLRLGAGIFNLGWTTKAYVSNRDPLPLYYRLGVCGVPKGLPATLYFSMTLYHEYADNYTLKHFSGKRFMDFLGEIYYSLGAEFQPMESFYLRLGYDTQGLDQRVGTQKDALAGISGGVGFDLTIAQVDIGLASYGEMGLVNRISLSTAF